MARDPSWGYVYYPGDPSWGYIRLSGDPSWGYSVFYCLTGFRCVFDGGRCVREWLAGVAAGVLVHGGILAGVFLAGGVVAVFTFGGGRGEGSCSEGSV